VLILWNLTGQILNICKAISPLLGGLCKATRSAGGYLLRVIHGAERDPMDISRALQADGLSITIEETEEIFRHFDLKKKA